MRFLRSAVVTLAALETVRAATTTSKFQVQVRASRRGLRANPNPDDGSYRRRVTVGIVRFTIHNSFDEFFYRGALFVT